jgi:signal transduction histidine kinase
MVRLVDDLLDVSRVSRGKLELRLETVSLEQVLNDAIEGCHPAIGAAGHSLQLQLPERPLLLRGDLTRLAQVFSNLVNNASKYTPPAGRIELRARQEGQQVVVEVADNGSGIGPGMLPHVFDLFDLFAQGGSSMQLSQSGLGIGLWLVKNLVELHGGSIDAASAGVGLGSTFTVRLPLAA